MRGKNRAENPSQRFEWNFWRKLRKLESASGLEFDYRYLTDMYKLSVDAEGGSPEYYNSLKYYVLSGGDKSYISESYADPINGYGQILKNITLYIKAEKKIIDSGGNVTLMPFGATGIIDLSLDNLSYFAEKYNFKGADTIKQICQVWENASSTVQFVSAIFNYNIFGAIKCTYSLAKKFIDTVKDVYENAKDKDAAWYALMYYHLKKNNERLLESIMNPDGSVGLRNGFDLNFDTYFYGYDTSNSDPIERSVVKYFNGDESYLTTGYLGYTYSVPEDFRNYILICCDEMLAIENFDIESYKETMLECIIAELNYKNGVVGVTFELEARPNDSMLGEVSGNGEYLAESTVILMAEPYENVTFTGWKDLTTGEVVSNSKEYQITVRKNENIVAEFSPNKTESARIPEIVTQPKGASYVQGDNVEPLTVTAYSTDEGEVKIDWYVSNVDSNTGGTYCGSGNSFYPKTKVQGTYYYYAVVKNIKTNRVGKKTVETVATLNSDTARVVIQKLSLTSIKVLHLPNKIDYSIGEELNPDGMVVVACYENGTEEVVAEYTIECDFSKAGETTVKVKYQECEAEFFANVKEYPVLRFSGASLSLSSDISVKYEVKSELFVDGVYSNPYVIFRFNDKEITVSEYTVKDERLIFAFTDIAPKQMNDTIYATLYAEINGDIVSSTTREYSVATYCYSMLDKYSINNSNGKFCTLLVDMLNYGAAAQTYFNYNTENMVNSRLTEEQRAMGTQDNPNLMNILDRTYVTIEEPTVIWKGAGLRLEEAVTIRYKISTEDITDLAMKIESESGEKWNIAESRFIATDGGYYVYFDGLRASKMSEPVYATVYRNGKAVSDTVRYSIESYACSMQESTVANLPELLIAMMKYGNSAQRYVNE